MARKQKPDPKAQALAQTRTLNASYTSALGHTMLNEVRGQWARDKEPGQANSAQPEAVITTGGGSLNKVGSGTLILNQASIIPMREIPSLITVSCSLEAPLAGSMFRAI